MKGAIITIVLVFGLAFITMLGGLFTFILLQHRVSVQRIAWEGAFRSAEAGIDYYKWCLNNNSEGNCLFQKNYYDGSGNLMGEFSLNVVSDTSCGETILRRIDSTGKSSNSSEIERTIRVIYGRESVAKFAYLIKESVWAGSDRVINGPYHSNGGIRMDGKNSSLVTSGISGGEWVCTSSFGCSPCPVPSGCRIQGSSCICPAVFTTTENANIELFNFPVSPFSFEGITVDMANIKNKAQASSIYLPPSVGINSLADGYHLKFKSNGTVEVWIITLLWSDYAYNEEEGWHYDYFRIRTEYLYNTYPISNNCPVIFVEDNLWVEGVVSNRVTLVSANLISSAIDTSVILPANITYLEDDGSSALAIIAEKNILISPSSPDNMELFGIFIAQKGRVGRNHYAGNIRNNLTITGSVISSGRVGTQWTSGSYVSSGYLNRQNYVDQNLVYSAPPFVPNIEHNFKVIKWEEVE